MTEENKVYEDDEEFTVEFVINMGTYILISEILSQERGEFVQPLEVQKIIEETLIRLEAKGETIQ